MKPRFRDIKRFPHCAYRVDVTWTYLEDHIQHQSEPKRGAVLDLDPDFQRAHVWTEAQQVGYVEYILQGGASGRELYFNCTGWDRGWEGPYVIVDGKQRLQAVRRFMANEIPAFGHKVDEYEGKPDMSVARFSWNVAAVQTRAEVLEWYLNFNSSGSVHTQEELSRVRELLARENVR